jgi:elongation factor Ts
MSVTMTELHAIKELRQRTGLGLVECRDAIARHSTPDAAEQYLRSIGHEFAVSNRAHRRTSVGRVHSYVHHNGRYGSLVAFACETDFAADSEVFKEFMHNVCLHAAATERARWEDKDVPLGSEGKPDYSQYGQVLRNAFLDEPYVKDQTRKINDLIVELESKIGEKVEIIKVQQFRFAN